MRKVLALATLVFFFALPSAFATSSICDATAGNLVVNCGFETRDFSGWTHGGNLGYGGVSGGYYANSGNYGAQLGPIGSDGTLSQTLTTVSGGTYNLSFYLYSAVGYSDFTALWDGNVVWGPLVNPGPFAYTQESVSGLSGTGSDILQFSFRQDPSYWGLDDIVVTSAVPPPTIPEPGTLTLFGAGILSLAGYVRRKRRA